MLTHAEQKSNRSSYRDFEVKLKVSKLIRLTEYPVIIAQLICFRIFFKSNSNTFWSINRLTILLIYKVYPMLISMQGQLNFISDLQDTKRKSYDFVHLLGTYSTMH